MTDKITQRVAANVAKRASALQALPASRHTDKLWNKLHDLDNYLDDAAHKYDIASSYKGYPGEHDAGKVMKLIEETQKQINQLTNAGGAFDKLFDAERDFVKKHGLPDDYADGVRKQIYPR